MIKKISQFQKEASFGTTVLFTIAIIIVLNFFVQEMFLRLDLTQNKDYSISEATQGVIKNIDDVVTIKTYFSGGAPAQTQQTKRDVIDVLEAYQNYSGGKITVINIDPDTDPSLKQELRSKGIPELQFNDYGNDKLQVVNGYMGIAIEYGDKTEVMPVVENTENFEYQMTVKLKKITSQKPVRIGYLINGSTTPESGDIKTVSEAMAGLYELSPVDLSGKTEVENDINALLIVNPQGRLGDGVLKKLDSFVMRGGQLAIFASGIKRGEGLQASVNDLDLNKLIEEYGLKINNDLVLDASSGVVSFSQGFMTFSSNYPFWPKLSKNSFLAGNTIVARLNEVVLPWPSSISILDRESQDGEVTKTLAKSSKKSWVMENSFDLNPQQDFAPSAFKQSVLAVEVSGKIKSAYGKSDTTKGKIVLVSDGQFMEDGFIKNQPDNANFFVNIVDSLVAENTLSQIRAKGVTSRPIKADLSDAEKNSIRYSNIFGVALIVAGYGVFRYIKRRKKKVAID